ncbi:hypothetical protein AMC90_CH03757 [Rhizobium phaseoli]|uniref:Uncharacterized protein n=2 Tax=Rhizobium TaxID=379 RepID=A0A192TFY1_9HYPH|nr:MULTISPECIES: hypothetical protein [Rhizobium]ACE92756.1 hypothetical conserved protein [Rhizobium etli CIAT 652]MDH6649422.1 hypothetical protein [Rhizobium esperanzae]ANL29523.1 hypothetical protein AMC90_CH03757 [Rhizobium phaseoli]ANL42087.1 hypothetical protein AMC88_CH03742 [Rhizobium phaseoli]ANL54797.1 hypothetical protein AMC86_CH03702 [Rhizobium phaseoli]
MVSALDSTRVVSAQYALKNLRNSDDDSQDTQSSSAASILSSYGLDPSSASLLSNQALSGLLDTLSSQSDTTEETDATGDRADITSASFMAMLKQQLQEAAAAEGESGKAHNMLAALEAGTLTISDPTQGVSVAAWDVDDPDEADTESKAGKAIDVSGWSDFLNTHLERGSDGAFVKENGSYVDQTTDSNAFFGLIGSNYYYLSWPQAAAK